MNCTDARTNMLIADPAELRSGGDTALAGHLSGCAKCRTVAAAIVGDTTVLGDALQARRRASSRWVRRAALAAIPATAAAAAIVAAVALRDRSPSPVPSVTPVSGRLPAARHVSLDIARGQRATVIKTADPNVTLIWLSPGVGQ